MHVLLKMTGMDLVGCFVLIDVGDCARIPCSFIRGKHSNFKINQYAKKEFWSMSMGPG